MIEARFYPNMKKLENLRNGNETMEQCCCYTLCIIQLSNAWTCNGKLVKLQVSCLKDCQNTKT